MSAIERLGNIYKVALGATLAFWFTEYNFEAEGVSLAGRITTLIFLAAFFYKRHLESKALKNSHD